LHLVGQFFVAPFCIDLLQTLLIKDKGVAADV